ncbi:MAG TPA: glutaredoxin domain-containing protein [Candidatus Lokiarchaeia archaeon]|nr:glutaredoxin domain-containing protein [Candidatus Lokiarchaeia archaeon]
MLELFTTSTCTKCAVLEKKLENAGIPFVKRVIDVDPEAQTDALMLGIHELPALCKDRKILELGMMQSLA